MLLKRDGETLCKSQSYMIPLDTAEEDYVETWCCCSCLSESAPPGRVRHTHETNLKQAGHSTSISSESSPYNEKSSA